MSDERWRALAIYAVVALFGLLLIGGLLLGRVIV